MEGRGRFITLEGGEATGKSTLARAIDAHLRGAGRQTTLTREPGGTPLAEALRAIVLSPPGEQPSALSQSLIFSAARCDHIEKVIRPALATGRWVLCDRFVDSTEAYQSSAAHEPISSETLGLLNELLPPERPDLTLILDLPLEEARRRIERRKGASDVFEDRDDAYHERVRQAFLRIAEREPERCVVLDAALPPNELADAAIRIIGDRLDRPSGD
ncbi:dTMP kinase [bacterium]|nr:dTMP kinase [bacterium]